MYKIYMPLLNKKQRTDMNKTSLLPLTTNKKVWISMAAIFSILCGIIIVLFYFQEIFIVLLLGICLLALVDKGSRIFNKYTSKLTKKQKYVLAAILILILASVLVYLIMIQVEHLMSLILTLPNLQEMVNRGFALLLEFLRGLPEPMVDELHLFVEKLIDQIGSIITSIVSQLLYYALCMVLIYPIMFSLYLTDKEKIKKEIMKLVPVQFQGEFKKTTSTILVQSNNYFIAKILESIGMAILSCIGFYIVGLPGWLFLGIIMGLLNNVPYIGPIIGSIPPIIIGLAIGWKVAVFAFIVCLTVQIIDNIYFIPVMISGKVSLNPLTTVLVILIFAQLFGPLGMILSIPIYIIFQIILTESYQLLTHVFPEVDDSVN